MVLLAPGGEDRMFKCPEKVLYPLPFLAIVNKIEIGVITSAGISSASNQQDFQSWEKLYDL